MGRVVVAIVSTRSVKCFLSSCFSLSLSRLFLIVSLLSLRCETISSIFLFSFYSCLVRSFVPLLLHTHSHMSIHNLENSTVSLILVDTLGGILLFQFISPHLDNFRCILLGIHSDPSIVLDPQLLNDSIGTLLTDNMHGTIQLETLDS